MESREERLAKNEALFREVNNRIVDVGSSSLGLEVVCECGDGACDDVLPISIDEYAQIRSEPTLFLVVPGHDTPEVERDRQRNRPLRRRTQAPGRGKNRPGYALTPSPPRTPAMERCLTLVPST
jgi:hypothetical protein